MLLPRQPEHPAGLTTLRSIRRVKRTAERERIFTRRSHGSPPSSTERLVTARVGAGVAHPPCRALGNTIYDASLALPVHSRALGVFVGEPAVDHQDEVQRESPVCPQERLLTTTAALPAMGLSTRVFSPQTSRYAERAFAV